MKITIMRFRCMNTFVMGGRSSVRYPVVCWICSNTSVCVIGGSLVSISQ